MDKGRLHFSTLYFSMEVDSMLTAYCLTLVKIKGREISWHSSDLSGPSISKLISATASLKNVETPQQLFNSLKSHAAKQNMRLGITQSWVS